MTGFAERVGVGQRQPRDLIVCDLSRTRNWRVYLEDGRPGGTQTEHRTGRVDAHVLAPTVDINGEELREHLGFNRREMLDALNHVFGTNTRRITVNGR